MPRQTTYALGDSVAMPQLAAFVASPAAWTSVALAIYQGDDARWIFRLLMEGSTPFDLTGYTTALQFRTTVADLDLSTAVTPLMEITDAAGGEIMMTLSSELSRWMSHENYMWDLEITQTASSWTTTVARGTLTVTKEITRVL